MTAIKESFRQHPAPPSASRGWMVEDTAFDPAAIEKNGCKFMIGNGRAGVRGTLEEFSRRQLAACTLAGLYDQVPGKWREPVNAPNPFFVRVWLDGELLSPESRAPSAHRQRLDLRAALHSRETVFRLDDGCEVTLRAERFLSAADTHIGALRFAVSTSGGCRLVIEAGIDGDVWDLNGPHLRDFAESERGGVMRLAARTQEQGRAVAVAAAVEPAFAKDDLRGDEMIGWHGRLAHAAALRAANAEEHGRVARATQSAVSGDSGAIGAPRILRRMTLVARAGIEYSFVQYIAIFADDGVDGEGRPAPSAADAAAAACRAARAAGYDALLAAHRAVWAERWARSDVQIEGDDGAQLALRHSIYQLLIIAPGHSDRVSIPARGLSGQVYKGGVFWDTEIFMLPFFNHTQPETARRLLAYRRHTLDGARRKAADLGFRGAFYAWESQETGDDACTYFNVTDVFTGRPLRTYFRDRQVHISADVAVAVWRHFEQTGDLGFLAGTGAEVVLECARFFLSRACINPDTRRFELRDVVGPDEYHERVDNNAFTNAMVAATLRIALDTLALLAEHAQAARAELVARLDYGDDARRLEEMAAALYRPQPAPGTGIIEQFDGYRRLEDASLAEVRARVIKPNEYWGATHGVAANTKVIKQADVVLMTHLFRDEFSDEVKRANWEYYEPRTEHGSSLSPCVYALVAADIGKTDWAYRYFLKTATIDLTGNSKQYVGPLYIGGTHPAANGGAWMTAVLGFGGLRMARDFVSVNPILPSAWRALAFRFCTRGQWFAVRVTRAAITVTADAANTAPAAFELHGGARRDCAPGETITSATATA
ncbi:glycoside hydrolase family 65 protein [Termitidicoccus mucosus]